MTTNTQLQASGYRCQRFVRAERELAQTDLTQVNELASVLDAVHQHGPHAFTSYSNIFDLKTGKIFLFNMGNYDEAVELDLAAELARETLMDRSIVELFQHSPTLDDVRAGEQRVHFDTRVESSSKALARFVGTYSPEHDTSVKFKIRQENGALLVDNPGQPVAELFPESPTVFRLSPDRGQVSFQLDEDDPNQVTGLILHKARDMKAIRIDD